MGVDDEIRHNALLCPGHVLLAVGDANSALLPMPTGKFITHLGYPDGAHLACKTHLSRFAELHSLHSLQGTWIALFVACNNLQDP